MDEHFKQRNVNDWLAEHQRKWDAMTPEEQEATRAKNKADQEEWERKLEGKSIEQLIGEDIATACGKPDWVYRDLPKMRLNYINEFIRIVGEDNIHWITYATYENWGPNSVDLARGQILISPAGIENIARFNEENKNN